VVLYIAEGAAGAPFFAGQKSGIGVLKGPTSGYLFGFLLTALITGGLAKFGWDRKFHTSLVALVAGNLAVYFVGIPVLAVAFLGWADAFTKGLVPFLIGDAIKLLLAALVTPLCWQLTALLFNIRKRSIISFRDYCCC